MQVLYAMATSFTNSKPFLFQPSSFISKALCKHQPFACCLIPHLEHYEYDKKSENCYSVRSFFLGRTRERKKDGRGSERISESHHKIAAFQPSSKTREMTFNLKSVITSRLNYNWGNEAWNRGGKEQHQCKCAAAQKRAQSCVWPQPWTPHKVKRLTSHS